MDAWPPQSTVMQPKWNDEPSMQANISIFKLSNVAPSYGNIFDSLNVRRTFGQCYHPKYIPAIKTLKEEEDTVSNETG